MKSFIPFPIIDDNCEREQLVYYPSQWSSSTPPQNSKAMFDKRKFILE